MFFRTLPIQRAYHFPHKIIYIFHFHFFLCLGGEDPDELFSIDQSLLSGVDLERNN